MKHTILFLLSVALLIGGPFSLSGCASLGDKKSGSIASNYQTEDSPKKNPNDNLFGWYVYWGTFIPVVLVGGIAVNGIYRPVSDFVCYPVKKLKEANEEGKSNEEERKQQGNEAMDSGAMSNIGADPVF